MIKKLLLTIPTIIGIALFSIAPPTSVSSEPMSEKSIYDFAAKSIDGKEVALSSYRGKVLLIVNSASKCGFTPQYADLEQLYTTYKDRGVVVLGFPSNDFLGQEPGTNQDIKTFCERNYGVTFPLFEKDHVTGSEKQPIFKYLTEQANPEFAGSVRWNFEKFLIDQKGTLVARWRSLTKPMSSKITEKIESLLTSPLK
jgi:glutathione peroxidase